ncbi:hypothetical protein OID55_10910 [Streptomyces sp. NBC_00715]|uniref:hypothetical protein n=1 Tax=Streptomyces sp. NBC_00715 TaxID=2975811 RepID=UPI003863AA16
MSNTVAFAVKPTVDHLMDAPLDDLLAEFDVEQVTVTSIPDPAFTGYMTVGKSGRLLLASPPARPQAEREITVRGMLGAALGVTLPDLPDPFRVSVFDEAGDPQQVNPKPQRSQWQALKKEDVATLPIDRLIKAFGVAVVANGTDSVELAGEPGDMQLRVGRSVSQQDRDSEARRLLAEYVDKAGA